MSELDRLLETVMNADGEDRQALSDQYADALRSEAAMDRTKQLVSAAEHHVKALEAALKAVRAHQETAE